MEQKSVGNYAHREKIHLYQTRSHENERAHNILLQKYTTTALDSWLSLVTIAVAIDHLMYRLMIIQELNVT